MLDFITLCSLVILASKNRGKNRGKLPPFGEYLPPVWTPMEEFTNRYGTPDLLAEDMLDGVYSPDECRNIFEKIFLLYKREQYPVQELLQMLAEDDRNTGELITYTQRYSNFYVQMWPQEYVISFYDKKEQINKMFDGSFTEAKIKMIFELSMLSVSHISYNDLFNELKKDARLTHHMIKLAPPCFEEFLQDRENYRTYMMSYCRCGYDNDISIPLFVVALFPDNDWNVMDFLHYIKSWNTAIEVQMAFPNTQISKHLVNTNHEIKLICDLIHMNCNDDRLPDFLEGVYNLIEVGFEIRDHTFDYFMESFVIANSPMELSFMDGNTIKLPAGWAYESLQEQESLQGDDTLGLYLGHIFLDPLTDYQTRQDLFYGEELDDHLVLAYYNSDTFEDRIQYNPGCMEGIGQRFDELVVAKLCRCFWGF